MTNETNMNNNTFDVVDFPTVKETRKEKLSDYLGKYPVFPIQRGIDARAPELAMRLANTGPLAKHCEVDVVKYTGPTVTEPATFVKGREYQLDGHTRNYIWDVYYKGGTLNGVGYLQLPKYVTVNVYEESDAEKLKDLYYVIDNIKSGETTPQKVQGVCRDRNLLRHFTNTKMRKGDIVTIINQVCPIDPKDSFQVDGAGDLFDQIDLLQQRDVLVEMDKYNAPGRGAVRTSYAQAALWLCFMTPYEDMDMFETGLKRLLDYKKTDDLDENTTEERIDGIYWIKKANRENPVTDVHNGRLVMENALPFSKGMYTGRRQLMSYFIYCFDHYMSGKTMPDAPSWKKFKSCYQNKLEEVWNTDK